MAKILIVDDSEFIRVVMKKYLNKIGHEVVGEAGDAQEAVELYKSLKPDVVTLDLIMPTGGCVALQGIKEYDPEAKIVICSSAANAQNVIKAIKLGAKSFLNKPACAESLNKVISDAMTKSADKALSNNGCFGFSNDNKFLLSMYNDTLRDAGIYQNDMLIIQKSPDMSLNDLVLVAQDDCVTIGYYKEINGKPKITSESSIVPIDENKHYEVIGIVKGMLRLFNPRKLQLGITATV